MIGVLLKGIGRHKVKEGFRVDKSGMPDPPLDRLTDADGPRFTRIMEPGADPFGCEFSDGKSVSCEHSRLPLLL